MCKYEVQVKLNYGEMNIECGDNYNDAIAKFKKVKNDFLNVPATITLYNNDKDIEQFTSKTESDCNFTKLYNELVDTLVKINEVSTKLNEQEKELAEEKNKSYHKIEEMDYDELDVEMLLDLKKNLTKRRIVKEENREFYAFHEANCKILEILSDFKRIRPSKIHEGKNKAYRQKYYKENKNCKERRISVAKDLKLNK